MRTFFDQLEDFLEQDLAGLERSVEFVACVDQLKELVADDELLLLFIFLKRNVANLLNKTLRVLFLLFYLLQTSWHFFLLRFLLLR